MKGKLRILGHVGLALFVAVALMLAAVPAAKVEAATAVTDVWVDFPFTTSINAYNSSANHYYIHFTPTTALSRGVDWVTVTFPDGSTAMGITAFSTISSVAAAELEFSTNYDTASPTWKRSTSDATCGGYRVKVKLPIDVAAGQDVWLKIISTGITSANVERIIYKVYVSTTKDTTPVLSRAFALGDDVVDSLTVTPLVTTAGVGTQYIAEIDPSTTVGVGGKVTIKFPLGTTMPSSISTTYVLFGANSTDYSNATAATVDADLRTITGTTPIQLVESSTTKRYMKILSGAGVANPQTATAASKCMIRTSTAAQWFLETGRDIVAGAATKIIVADGGIGIDGVTPYSDDATMINMLSGLIYVTMADQYGNAKLTSSAVTVSLTSSSGSGTFYTGNQDDPVSTPPTYSSVTSLSVNVADPTDQGQQVFYKDTTAGTHTLTFSHASYTDATWTITLAPAISLYDASDNLVNTYGAISTSPVAELGSDSGDTVFADAAKYGVDYVNDAITAAFAGDTIKLGDGTYEMDAAISLDKAITLTSVNGASSTTLRPTTSLTYAIIVGTDGSAANPVIIDGFTIQRLRNGTEIEVAVWNRSYDYVTVRNCIFNYIYPVQMEQHHYGGVIMYIVQTGVGTPDNITSATVSNNTFNNCGSETWPQLSAGKTCIVNFHMVVGTAKTITGVTVSGNTFTDCNGHSIIFRGSSSAAAKYVTGSITNNTFTNSYSTIQFGDAIKDVSVTGNTFTKPYAYAIKIQSAEGYAKNVTIKNNTITGCAGTYAIDVEKAPYVSATYYTHYIQYNDIYDNYSYALRIRDGVGNYWTGIDCKYNWFGDASGPAYTALTGAKITKSNPDGTGDKVTDRCIYYPWLHKSVANVVADNASWQTSTVKLVSGWNTLSTPVKLITTADAIDELIPSGMTIGYYYDAGWQLITTGYVLNACDAVYVKMNATTYVLLKFDASAFSTPSKDLAAGWNMMSLAYLSSAGKQADDAVASVALTAAGLPGYSQVISPSLNATQTNMFGVAGASWAYSSGQTIADPYTETMYAGLGYWIYMQNAATLAGFEITPIAPDLD